MKNIRVRRRNGVEFVIHNVKNYYFSRRLNCWVIEEGRYVTHLPARNIECIIERSTDQHEIN